MGNPHNRHDRFKNSLRDRAARAHGTEDRKGPTQGMVLADLFRHEGQRSARLADYLSTTPSGERDVSKELDRLEKQRGTWLRGVLDCCED